MIVGTLAVSIIAKTQKFRKGTTLASKIARGFTRSLAVMGAGAASAAGPVLALARTHDQLQRSMNASLAIMSGVTQAMRGDMTQAAIEVSRTTRFSAAQAAQGYFFLASAGFDAAQSLAAMPQVAAFAQAGNFDLALATDLATDAQSALGLTSKDAAENLSNLSRVTDVLIKGNTLANASAQQFSEAITNKAGAALRLVNKDIEEGVAVLAAYADQGIKGAEAGTALGIVMRDLQTKALKHKAAFAANNIAVFDQSGKMRQLADIIQDIERRLDGMSDAQKKATLLAVGFSDKSVAYIQTLIGTSEKIRGYEEALRLAGGATQDVADKQLTTMEKATARLGAAWEKLAANMGPVVDVLADIAIGTARQTETLSGQAGLIVHFADLLHNFRIAWLFLRQVINGVVGGMALLLTIIVKIAEKLTGLDGGFGDFLGSVSVAIENSAKDIGKQLDEALIAKTPVEKWEQAMAKMRAAAKKTAPEIEKVTKPETLLGGLKKFGERSIGKQVDFAKRFAEGFTNVDPLQKAFLNQALGQATFGLLGSKPALAGIGRQAVEPQRAAALVRGSQEARSASLRNVLGSNSPLKQVAKNTKRAADAAEETRDAIKDKGEGQLIAKAIG